MSRAFWRFVFVTWTSLPLGGTDYDNNSMGKIGAGGSHQKGIHDHRTSPATHWRAQRPAGYVVPEGSGRVSRIVDRVQQLYYEQSKKFVGD